MRKILAILTLTSGLATASATAQSSGANSLPGQSDMLVGVVWLVSLGVFLGFFLGVIWGLGQGDHAAAGRSSQTGTRPALPGRRAA